jgi:hypothetical protein
MQPVWRQFVWMTHSLDYVLHASESFTGISVFLIFVRVEGKAEPLDYLTVDSFIYLVGDPLKDFYGMILIDFHEVISYLPLEGLILNRIPALIYYIVYYYLTHSHLHIFTLSIFIAVIFFCCLFEKVLLVAPLIGL